MISGQRFSKQLARSFERLELRRSHCGPARGGLVSRMEHRLIISAASQVYLQSLPQKVSKVSLQPCDLRFPIRL